MGGQDGNRGYLVQAIVAVMQSLSNNNWEYVAIEPDEANEKVDIQWWDKDENITAFQVKSSINNFDKSDILSILDDLVTNLPNAVSYSLILIGTYSADTVKFFNGFKKQDKTEFTKHPLLDDYKNKISVGLKALDIPALDAQIESNLHAFISAEGFVVPYQVIQLITLGLTAQFTRFATDGRKVIRGELRGNIIGWMKYNYPKELKKDTEGLSLASYWNGDFNATGGYNLKIAFDSQLIDGHFANIQYELWGLVEKILAIDLPQTISPVILNNPNWITFISPLPIVEDVPAAMSPEDIKELQGLATVLINIDLPPSFFYVGQAMRPKITNFMDLLGRGVSFVGKADEVKKAELLDDFKWKIKRLSDLEDCRTELQLFRMLPAVIINEGDGLQSNIELQMSFPDNVTILTPETFPKPEYNTNMELLSQAAGIIQRLFILIPDSRIKRYDYREVEPIEYPIFDPFFGKPREEYERLFNQSLKWVFDYRIYNDVKDRKILSCVFKNIKPKDAMMLPSIILFKSDGPFEITYYFKSDQSASTEGKWVIN